LSRANEQIVAVVVLQEGLIIDLDSEFFQSDEYTKLVEQVKENTAMFLIKVGNRVLYIKADHMITAESTYSLIRRLHMNIL